MAEERSSVRKPAVVERRPAVAARVSPAAAAPRPMPVSRALQQRLGNVGTQALAAQVVARSTTSGLAPTNSASLGQLAISHPDDDSEREAERVADTIMRMPEATSPYLGNATSARNVRAPVIQRRCTQCEEEDKGTKVQRRESSAEAPEISPSVSDGIRALKGRGSPLPDSTRAFFEPRFGIDFGHVRIHTDTRAASTAGAISAKAFTAGHDIAFAVGQFAPDSLTGRHLLAHELTHVMQQGHSPARSSSAAESVQRDPADAPPAKTDPAIVAQLDDEIATWNGNANQDGDKMLRAKATRMVLLLQARRRPVLASQQDLDAFTNDCARLALTELDTLGAFSPAAAEGALGVYAKGFPLTWAARVRDTLSLEVDLKSIKARLDENSKYAESLAKRIPTSLFGSGLARTFAEALKSETPFELELRHAEWPKPHATRDYALGWIEYARTQAEVSFYEFWQSIVQSLSDDISSGKIKIDLAFQASYKDFMENQRGVVLAIPGKIRAFGPRQPELSGDDILNDVERVALVVNNIASLASTLTFVPIWFRAEETHAEKVSENDGSIATRLDPNGRVIQAMLWAYEGDYFSEAGKRTWQAIKASAPEDAAQMAAAMILQMIPFVNVAVDLYFLYQGVKGIDAALKGLQATFVSASNATTTVDLQRESAALAQAITGQGASLILSLLAVIGAVKSLRAKAAKIKGKNPKMSDEEAMNEALKDTRSKEGAALREASKKQPGFTPEEIQISQQKAKELAKQPENVRAIDDPVYDTEIDLLDGKKYRRMRGRDVWCLFKNPTKCDSGFSSEVNQAADNAAKSKKARTIPSAAWKVVEVQNRTTFAAARSFRAEGSTGYIYIIRGTRNGTTLVLKVGSARIMAQRMPQYTFLEKPETKLGKQVFDKGLKLDIETHAVQHSGGTLSSVETAFREKYGRGPWDRQIGPGERPEGSGVPRPNDNATLNEDLTWTWK